jgi:hypothetical protein
VLASTLGGVSRIENVPSTAVVTFRRATEVPSGPIRFTVRFSLAPIVPVRLPATLPSMIARCPFSSV